MHVQTQKLYDSLFESAWQSIAQFGKTKNLHMGMITILHTWGQNLSLHPCTLHYSGGGINARQI
ncbi:MAG: hypothetical protein R2831_12705 [Chitinophagaceae bacterium]